MTTLAACQLVIALLAASRQARPASTASSLVRGYPEPAQLDEAAGDYDFVDGCAGRQRWDSPRNPPVVSGSRVVGDAWTGTRCGPVRAVSASFVMLLHNVH